MREALVAGIFWRRVAVLMITLAAAMWPGGAAAVEIEDVTIEDRVSLGTGGPALVLNGAGVRHRMAFIKVYVGALYLASKATDADEIIRDPGAKRVSMHILAEEVTAKEFVASLNNALAANHIPAELALIESRIRDLNRMMHGVGTLKKGSVVLIDYLPGAGTRVTVDGRERASMKGEDFFQALLRIWIGKKPVDGRLRDAMLGGGTRPF